MQVVILAGGLGTRLAEYTEVRPKPMVEIGGRPILWHIMKHYAHYGFNEFIIALGYKSEIIKRYFLDYYALNRNLTVNLGTGDVSIHDVNNEDWTVHLVDTGLHTFTGGRLKHLQPILRPETFMMTYGDGVSDINLHELLAFHKSHGCIGTVSTVRPPSRFGGIALEGNSIKQFIEKPRIGEMWINGGFQVFEPEVLNYVTDDQTSLENDVLEQLAQENQLAGYRHEQFWQCMDNIRELRLLEQLWESGNPPWKVWS